MTLLAKPVVKNKCWVVEEDSGRQVATILSTPNGVTLVHDGQREKFTSFKLLSDRYNIVLDKTKTVKKEPLETHDVYGFPCDYHANNILWDVQHRLPIFTKGTKSKSFFCAGYYIVQFNNGWVKSYCPKLITLNRYPFQGPYKTKEDMQIQLRIANSNSRG
jgi:hypothetical protein